MPGGYAWPPGRRVRRVTEGESEGDGVGGDHRRQRACGSRSATGEGWIKDTKAVEDAAERGSGGGRDTRSLVKGLG
ncbi:hypothetical protein GCM10020220_046280 [Nonomuraea rubra]